MSYSLPIIVIFGGLMAVTFAINPFRTRDVNFLPADQKWSKKN
jgi:hypothetical protein